MKKTPRKASASYVRKINFARLIFTGSTQCEAAIAAGYKNGKGLKAVASELAADSVVIAEIDRLRGIADESAVLTRNKALQLLTEISLGTMDDFLSEVEALDLKRARLLKRLGIIKKYTVAIDGKITVELYDKITAIQTLAKMEGWNFEEANEARLAAALARLDALEKEKAK